VAGIVALMAQKYPALMATQAETILEGFSSLLSPGLPPPFTIPDGSTTNVCWDGDATGAGLTTADAALAATP